MTRQTRSLPARGATSSRRIPRSEQVLSFRVGARKPAVPFFEACIRASDRAADEIIYIDDRPDYVAVATALGMRAFVYDPALPPPAL